MLSLSEIYSDEFSSTKFFIDVYNDGKLKNPTFSQKNLLQLAKYSTAIQSINYGLLNHIEESLIKKRKAEFKTLAFKYDNIKDIMKRLFTNNELDSISNKIEEILKSKLQLIKNDYSSNNIEINALQLNQVQEEKLSDYEMIKKLGSGSYGAVFLAISKITGKKVAIKKMERVDGSEIKEYERLIKLKDQCNQHFICVYNIFNEGNYLYMVMEYLDDFAPLSDYMKQITNILNTSTISSDLMIINKIINNICIAIKELHRKKFAHNDLKPDNIMCNINTGEIRFIDFGISCEDTECTLNSINRFTGTPLYMDPFLYNKLNKRIMTSPIERSFGDLWAFGIIIYEMVIGRTPMVIYFKNLDIRNLEPYFKNYKYETDVNRDLINNILTKLINPPNLDHLLVYNGYNRQLICD